MHQKTKIVAGVTVVICAIMIAIFAGALYILSQKKEALRESATQVATAKARASELTALVRLADDTQAERAELHTRVLAKEGVIDFLSLIETLAKEQRVTLKTNTLTVNDVSSSFELLTVNVSLSGSNDAVLHVIEILETLPYQAEVVRVSITNNGLIGEDVWQADVELVVTKMKKT